MRPQIATLLSLAAPLFAIEITSPSKGDVVDLSKGVTVEWTTVSTDPDTAHLVLVNMAGGHTPFTKDLGEVDLSTGSYTVKVKDVPSDTGYQFNFESNEPLNTGILAQSAQFEVTTSSEDEDEQSSSSSTATSSPSSSSSSGTTAASASTTSGSETTATTLTTSTSASAASASASSSASSSSSTDAAAPTGLLAQSGSLFALVVSLR